MHDLHELLGGVHLQPEDDAEAVAQRRGQRARARRRADQRELGQLNADAVGHRALASDDVQRVVLHRRIEHLFHGVGQAVNLVDEQHVALREIRHQRDQIARALDGRAAGDADVRPHLGGDDVGQRRLAQAGRTVEQDMIQRLASLARRLNVDIQAVLHRLLAHVFAQRFGAQAALLIVVLLAEAAHDKAFFIHLLSPYSNKLISFLRICVANLSQPAYDFFLAHVKVVTQRVKGRIAIA